MGWYVAVLKKYAVFDGRSRRKEYWFFILFNTIISFIVGLFDGALGAAGLLGLLYALAMVLPGLGVSVRRLHDTSRSGWWLLIGLIPVIGTIVLIIFCAQDGVSGHNAYGDNPKNVAA